MDGASWIQCFSAIPRRRLWTDANNNVSNKEKNEKVIRFCYKCNLGNYGNPKDYQGNGIKMTDSDLLLIVLSFSACAASSPTAALVGDGRM
jgi:hypothetical protein